MFTHSALFVSEMRYEKEIVDVLAKAGNNGLSVKKIARHVFNASNSFFEVLDFSEVHQQVQRCLLRNRRSCCDSKIPYISFALYCKKTRTCCCGIHSRRKNAFFPPSEIIVGNSGMSCAGKGVYERFLSCKAYVFRSANTHYG